MSLIGSYYLAARYARRLELLAYAVDLRGRGRRVTSRWLNGEHEALGGAGGADAEVPANLRGQWAVIDSNDLLDAATVISFTEPERSEGLAGRGGRHVEFGIALARGKRLVVIGHRENVFHCLPQVEFYPTWAAFLAAEFGTETAGAA